jgi:hypothetical protein
MCVSRAVHRNQCTAAIRATARIMTKVRQVGRREPVVGERAFNPSEGAGAFRLLNGWQRNDRGFSRGAMPEMSSHLFSPSASSFSFHEEISSPSFAGNFRRFAHNHNQMQTSRSNPPSIAECCHQRDTYPPTPPEICGFPQNACRFFAPATTTNPVGYYPAH